MLVGEVDCGEPLNDSIFFRSCEPLEAGSNIAQDAGIAY